jgi:hypothetical protein
MFDWPKHTKIQKFVSWEKAFRFKKSHPANTSHRSFIFIGVRFDSKLNQMKPKAKRLGQPAIAREQPTAT